MSCGAQPATGDACPAGTETVMKWMKANPINDVFGSSAVSDVAELSFLPITTPVAYISSMFDPYTDNEGRIVMRSLVLATPRRVLPVHAVDRGRLPAAG